MNRLKLTMAQKWPLCAPILYSHVRLPKKRVFLTSYEKNELVNPFVPMAEPRKVENQNSSRNVNKKISSIHRKQVESNLLKTIIPKAPLCDHPKIKLSRMTHRVYQSILGDDLRWRRAIPSAVGNPSFSQAKLIK